MFFKFYDYCYRFFMPGNVLYKIIHTDNLLNENLSYELTANRFQDKRMKHTLAMEMYDSL